jgi:hypothetical protein
MSLSRHGTNIYALTTYDLEVKAKTVSLAEKITLDVKSIEKSLTMSMIFSCDLSRRLAAVSRSSLFRAWIAFTTALGSL